MIPFVPVFAGLILGNGTVDAAYETLGQLAYYEIQVELGTTSHLVRPVALTLHGLPPLGNGPYACLWTARDVSTQTFYGGPGWPELHQRFTLYVDHFKPLGGAVPFTWLTGDILQISGHYTTTVPA